MIGQIVWYGPYQWIVYEFEAGVTGIIMARLHQVGNSQVLLSFPASYL